MKSRSARAFHLSLITAKLDELAEYHDRIEAFILREVAILHSRFEEGVAALTEERNAPVIRDVIRRTPGLGLRDDIRLKIDREYVASMIRDVRAFFDVLHKAFPD